jgi:hypothetical protein
VKKALDAHCPGSTTLSTLVRNESRPASLFSSCTIRTSAARFAITVRKWGWRAARL